MIEARFHPLDLAQWPGTISKGRKGPQFRSTWPQTLDLLESELRHLRAKDVVIQAAFEHRDIRNDGWPRADARKPSFPGVIISFQSKHGPQRHATDTYTDGSYWVSGDGGKTIPVPGWQANVRAIALTLEALRTVERHGAASRGEQYVGFGALPAATLALEAPMNVEEAARVLGLGGSSWTNDQIATAFRQKARETSEDGAALHRVQRARDILQAALR